MSTATLLEAFDRAAPALRAHGEAVRAQVAAWLAANGSLKLHSVTLRLKDRESLARKLARPDRTYKQLWDVTDLIGLRVITYFEDDVDRVGQVLEARLPVDFHRSIDKRRQRDDGRFGYRSLHYVCRLGSDDALPPDARYEIQVRTMLEHAWAEIEHDLGYKSRHSVPGPARRRLNRLAGLLELADQEFASIRRELTDYERALPARIAEADEAVALDRLSLGSLLDCSEARELDSTIARALGKPLGVEPFFPDYLIRMLGACGIDTVAGARAALVRHGAQVPSMAAPYFDYTRTAWGLALEQMPTLVRGYSLFFLAHALAQDTPRLGATPVERLTRLYHELDYPDDVEAAGRVARALVAAFRESRESA
jgi:ppGpp synthetase/RelA/SpoT-type nucleotidyltranferase